MTRFPSSTAYQEALQHPEDAFVSGRLRGATITETMLGLPRAYSGARAVVFPIEVAGERMALKCFVGRTDDLASRYRAIIRHVTENGDERLNPGEWLDDGVRVDGAVYPVLLSPWRPGATLRTFVEENLERPDVLRGLAMEWRAVIGRLEASGMAHGDLQHGNVLVDGHDGDIAIHLIDFDGAFVPRLRRRDALEVGHRNYQHPDRDRRDFDAGIDRFPSIAIYVALTACAERPELWERYDSGENLLFTAEDYYEPSASPLLDDMRGVEALAELTDRLTQCALLPLQDVPTLERFLEGNVPARRHRRRRDEHADHAVRGPFERFVRPAAASWLLASILIAAGGRIGAAVLMLAAGTIAFFGMATLVWHRKPGVRRRRRLEQELRYARDVIVGLEDESVEIARNRDAYLNDRERLRERRLVEIRDRALKGVLKHHFAHQAIVEAGVTHRGVLRLKRAGIRTAYHVTDEALERVTETSSENLRRTRVWRDGLVQRYQDELPAALSPAEERRLEREIAHRMRVFDTETARVAERIAMQRRVTGELEARLAAVESASYLTFVRHLLTGTPAADGVTYRSPDPL